MHALALLPCLQYRTVLVNRNMQAYTSREGSIAICGMYVGQCSPYACQVCMGV
jgi:hypothetical protein